MTVWNPWHGCHKISPGCQNCYVYRRDSQFGKDSRIVSKTANFDFPVQKRKDGSYRLQKSAEPVYTCMTSDFFLEEADEWRKEIWKMIRERSDLAFVIITKRIHRFSVSLPEDWGEGYENVTIICTCENQEQADLRLPVFLNLPIQHREIIEEPLLEEIHIEPYLATGKIQSVTCGGESGPNARICNYDWILQTRKQCMAYRVAFSFKQTGALFQKDGRLYQIDRKRQIPQARKAGIDYRPSIASRNWRVRPMNELFKQLSHSKFRSQFQLRADDKRYIQQKGMTVIEKHAADFVRQRLAPEYPVNDGKQTPMRGHPVFLAQHATGTCCRGCLFKWHGIPIGQELSQEQQQYVVSVLMEWIYRQMELKIEDRLE